MDHSSRKRVNRNRKSGETSFSWRISNRNLASIRLPASADGNIQNKVVFMYLKSQYGYIIIVLRLRLQFPKFLPDFGF